MIGDLRLYPAMKDSGVAWMGEVPEHWDFLPLRRLLRRSTERNRPDLPLLSVVRERGVILRDTSNREENRNYIPDDLSNYKVVRVGQFAVNKMKAWQGSYGVSGHDGLVSPAYFVFDLSGVGSEFFHAAIRSRAYVPFFAQASDGVRIGQWDLAEARMREIAVAIPPPDEQDCIVRFLDHVDRRISRYVASKRKLIALLNEQKQAIIHEAVTRGISPNASLEPSGNPWFPELPQGWQVLSLRRVVRRAVDGPHVSPTYVDEGIPFISARNVKTDRWSLEDAKYISEADYLEFSKRVEPAAGDVLYTKGGTTGIARAVDLDFRFQVWVHVAVLKLAANRVTPQYLAFALNSPRCYEQAQLLTRGATNQDLGLNRMKTIVLPVPPLVVQEAIVRHLEGETADLARASQSARRQIELVGEWRSRLIADVVTGRADVRKAAATLPEDAGDFEWFGRDESLEGADSDPEDLGNGSALGAEA